MANRVLSPGVDNLLEAFGLYDRKLKQYFGEGATVTATLYTPNKDKVTGCIDVPMVYTVGSAGDFVGEVRKEDSFNPELGDGYDLVVTANQGAANGEFHYPITVAYNSEG